MPLIASVTIWAYGGWVGAAAFFGDFLASTIFKWFFDFGKKSNEVGGQVGLLLNSEGGGCRDNPKAAQSENEAYHFCVCWSQLNDNYSNTEYVIKL